MGSKFNCGAETASTSVVKAAPDGEMKVVEVTHECRHVDDHDGSHKCLACGATWTDEVPC